MKYGTHQINRAGNTALTASDKREFSEAIDIINDWRKLHLPALDNLQNQIVPLLKKYNVNIYSVSRRLKRISSILNKLDRNPQSRLGTMQDIGGLRIVVPSMTALKKAYDIIVGNIPENFELTREPIDYIKEPKSSSGYRSIHFVFKYHSTDVDLNGMKIELQLRTKLQHSWAMAVETAELITGTALKSSQGADEWQDFFKIVSSLFAQQEQTPMMSEHRENNETLKSLMQQLYQKNKKANFNDTLKALSTTNLHARKVNYTDGYYILSINFVEKRLSIKPFPKERESDASALYDRLEGMTEENKNAVVLVSVPKIQQLQEAYPSYFLDTGEFFKAIDVRIKNCERWGWV